MEVKNLLTPNEKVISWRYLIVWRDERKLTVDIRRTRENFQRILYIWTTGMNPEVMEMTMDKAERSVVAWKRFVAKHGIDPKSNAFRERATEAFEKELEAFLSLKPAARYSAVVEVDPKVEAAVLDIYRQHGIPGSWNIEGHTVRGVKVQQMELLGLVMAKLKVAPEGLNDLNKQLKQIQSNPQMFISSRGKVGTICIALEDEEAPKGKKR